MQISFFISLFCILIAAGCFIAALVYKDILPPPQQRVPSFVNNTVLFSYSFTASLISILLIILYTPFTLYILKNLFENTQCTEIIFFLMFSAGCLCESVRILTPFFGLWSTFSDLLFFCGKITFTGRLLCPLSFVFAATASSAEHRQDVERNIFILAGICIVFAVTAPFNTVKITSTGTVPWGFPTLFLLARLLFTGIAFISFWINAVKQNAKEYKIIAFSMTALLCGYGILCASDNYAFMLTGFALFYTGTLKYLQSLHSLYMWK